MDDAADRLIGRQVTLTGHFDSPVSVEAVRHLAGGYEVRVRLGSGQLEETVVSTSELEKLLSALGEAVATAPPADPELLRLLVESARIRFAYTHDRQFAVNLSGIRTLPHQIEAVYLRMLPQPQLRFLLADDPGAGKTIMAGLLLKELKLREAVERILILVPAPLTIQWGVLHHQLGIRPGSAGQHLAARAAGHRVTGLRQTGQRARARLAAALGHGDH